MSTQRGTFVTWSKSTGKPFHNFITWKDLRADDLCQEWDSSYTMKVRYFLPENKPGTDVMIFLIGQKNSEKIAF
jgi:sugar (pentulose or hexulose) kinase